MAAAARILATGDQPARAVFLARALNALADVAPTLGQRSLEQVAHAPSDYAALLHALQDPGTLAAWRRQDPLADARLRGVQARARLLAAEGGAFTGEQVAALLGISRQAVDKRRRAGKLLAVQTGRRGYIYPAWQFDARALGGVLPGLELVLADLGVRGPWTRLSWFLTRDVRLGGARPLDALRRGRIDAVRAAAAAYGEQGAA
ncbi:MAG: hypothetical protein HY332_01275 [Chloroflexi bacterium]|nr:hypothetical protein [Chloroflexota bacterium]